MTAPFITAQNIFFVPPPAANQAAPRKKFVAAPESRCRALTKLPHAVDHRGPQCSRRKVFDTNTPQAQKSDRDLVADELCNQHKLMLDRFLVMIIQQLREEKMAIPGLASDPPVVAEASAGAATPQRGSSNSDMVGVSNEMVFNHGMGFGNGMNFTGDMNLDHVRGRRSPNASSMGDAARRTGRTSSSTSSVTRSHESRWGTTAFNPGTSSSGVIDQEIDQGAASITSQRRHIKSNSASSFRSRNDLPRSDFDAMNSSGVIDQEIDQGAASITSPRRHIKSNSASSFRSRNDLRRSDNTTAGPSTPLDITYPQITGNFDTPVAGLNSAFIAPSVSAPYSDHVLPMDDNRTRIPTGRETPQLYRGVSTAPSFQEAPNLMVNHASQKLVPSSRAARDHGSLVRQCKYWTELHNPRPDRARAGIVDWQKKRAIEDLRAAVDGLVSLDDAIAGSLISDCEALLTSHTPAAEGSLSTPDRFKLSKMRHLKEQVDILRYRVAEAVSEGEGEERVEDTESEL